MKYAVANIVQGFGPVVRLGQLLEKVNQSRTERNLEAISLIIPGNPNPKASAKQARILQEEFSDSGFAHQIYVDMPYGEILENAMFKGDSHVDFLRSFVGGYACTRDRLNRHFERDFKVSPISADDSSVEITVSPQACVELARNPLLPTPSSFGRSVSYEFGKRSAFLQEMQKMRVRGYNDRVVDEAIKLLTEEVELPRTIDFVQDPATLAPSSSSLVRTPLHELTRKHVGESLEPGIYVSVTGIPELAPRIIEAADQTGYKIYCSGSATKEFPNAIPQLPSVVTSPAIQGVFSRLGWGAINLALMSGKPLITIPSNESEDPEIILNQRLLVEELQVASLADGREFGEVLEESRERASTQTLGLLTRLSQAYGTLEGPVYASQKLLESDVF